MRKKEIEVEETEVERIYCDECGDECTDDHRIEPKEVCVSCSSESAVDRVTALMTPDVDEDGVPSALDMILFIGIFPIVILFLLAAGVEGEIDGSESSYIFFFTTGGIVWTAIILVLLL